MATKLEVIEKIVVKKPDKILSVSVPMTFDSVATVRCPYCQQPRTVEPDANYEVECEACEQKYKINSMF